MAAAAIAIVTLALGIGANAAVLGAFDALLLQDLPVAHPDRLVSIQMAPPDNPSQLSGASLPEFAALRDRAHAFDLDEDRKRRAANDRARADAARSRAMAGAVLVSGALRRLRGDTSKAERQLGWRPKVGFRELVRMMVDADLAAASKEAR